MVTRAEPGSTPKRSGVVQGWLLLLLVVIGGIAASYALSDRFREDAHEAWRAEATQSGRWLSGTTLSWLEESYAPLVATAALFENSGVVEEHEFLGAIDSVETRATALFVDSIAVVRREETGTAAEWAVQYSTDRGGPLRPAATLGQAPQILTAVETASAGPGRTVLGAPFDAPSGERYSPVALAVSDSEERELVLVGLLDFRALVEGLFEIHRPEGVTLRLDGRFPTPAGPGPSVHVFGERSPHTLTSSVARTVSADADLSLTWDFGPEYGGGPKEGLAQFCLLGGLFATAIVTLLVAVLLRRNQTITERVRTATAELEASGERFRALFDASADPHLILEDGRFSDCNQAAVDLLGYGDKAELMARRPGELSPEFQPDGSRSAERAGEMIAIARKQGHHRFDWVHEKKSGTQFPAEVTLTPIEIGGRQVLLTAWHDLTARQQAEEERRRQDAHLRAIIDNLPSVVALKDRDGRHLIVNAVYEQATGISPGQILGKSDADVLPAEVAAEISKIDRQVMESREPRTFEEAVPHPDGSVHDYLTTKVPLLDAAGDCYALVFIATDITQRKQAELRLRESEDRLESAARGAGLGLWDQDVKSDTLWVNDIWATMLGYEPIELRETDEKWSRLRGGQQGWRALTHPDDVAENHRRQNLERDADQDSYRAEWRVRCKNGDWKWILDVGRVTRRDESGRPVRVSGVHVDIDEQKRLTSELEQARDVAEEATRAKSDFLANMSHEIRTPMNAVIGFTHLALATELDRKQRDYLEKIQTAAKNLLGIINDILDFSKIEAGKLEVERVDFDLAEVLDGVANVTGVKSAEKGLELLVDLDPEIPLGLAGDPLRLNQILINLTNNAIKFTEAGSITISARLAEREGEDVLLHFAVRDTGIGMTEDDQSRLFQAFAQADSSTTRKFGGTGLGLTICKRLTQLMGGEIGVDSTAGEGSTFWFTVRVGIGAEPRTRGMRTVPEELRNLRVLVVDDHPTARTLLSRYLESFGFTADEVGSGSAAIETLETAESPYQLVLMDWKMPGMSGIEAVQQIRASDRITRTPEIILVSAYGRTELRDEADSVGVRALLHKPINPSTLLDATLEAMGHEFEGIRGPAAPQHLHEQLRGARVLLVEDNEINREVGCELLGNAGISVTTANDGAAGLSVLVARPDHFDAVLMDIQMPVMDGYTATREIRKDQRLNDVPVIAMTANAMAGDREKALSVGMNDHVAKPIDVAELFDVLNRWVDVPEERRLAAQAAATEAGDDEGVLDIPGVDTVAGIARMGGNVASYRKILEKFRQREADAPQRIRAALDAGDRTLARREAHTLNGVAGNLGADTVRAAAKTVEGLIDAGTPCDAELEELERVLGALVSAIPTPKSTTTAAAAPSSEALMEELSPVLEQLDALLEESNAEAIELVDGILTRFEPGAPPTALRNICERVEDFDFDTALELLRAFRA